MSAQITLSHSDWPDVDQAGFAIEPYYLINRGALCSFDIHVWPAFHVPFDIGFDRSTERSCGARRMAESAALLVDAVVYAAMRNPVVRSSTKVYHTLNDKFQNFV